MPTKPNTIERGAYEAAKKNPTFSKDALEAIINETAELRDALLKEGLVEEVKDNG